MEVQVGNPGLVLEGDKEEAEKGSEGEDVHAEPVRSVVVGEKRLFLCNVIHLYSEHPLIRN